MMVKDDKEDLSAIEKPNICKSCCVRVYFNQFPGVTTKTEFYETLKSHSKLPENFKLLSDEDTTSCLTAELRSLPNKTCYLCAGILHNLTIQKLVAQSREVLSEYECFTSIGVTCSNLDLLNVRSVLGGVGRLVLQVKTVFKWLFSDELSRLYDVPLVVRNSFSNDENDLIVNVDIKLDQDEYMWTCRPPVNWEVYNFTQGKFKIARLEEALARCKVEDVKQYMELPGKAVYYQIAAKSNAAYVGGRYTKHGRNISQTPWNIQDGLFIAGNVEDAIAGPLKKLCRADDGKMHSAGREDIDVRMLGTGRPFYIQLVNVKIFPKQEMLDKVQAEINQSGQRVKCHSLTVVTRRETELVKLGQEKKQKEYRCIIKTEDKVTLEMLDKLNSVQDLVLEQATPIRVLHRRTPLTRDRKIISVKARILLECEVEVCTSSNTELTATLKDRLIVADVISEAGTYIKEWVHGDFNRTVPNVGGILGTRCDMLQLDVLNLPMTWPPDKA